MKIYTIFTPENGLVQFIPENLKAIVDTESNLAIGKTRWIILTADDEVYVTNDICLCGWGITSNEETTGIYWNTTMDSNDELYIHYSDWNHSIHNLMNYLEADYT